MEKEIPRVRNKEGKEKRRREGRDGLVGSNQQPKEKGTGVDFLPLYSIRLTLA